MTTDLLKEVETIQRDIRQLADTLLEMLDNKENEISEKVASECRATLHALEEKTDKLVAAFHETGGQLLSTVNETVRKHPFGSLAAAAGLGMLVGALLRK
jgi:ElaB/YqjD/DUF883 family membrane-anchored ribosome-binding protein